MSPCMRHRHCIDHHMRIDDCDLERIAAQSGYPMHAAVRDIVTPVAACAEHARAVDQADRERGSAQNARVVEREQAAVDVEERDALARDHDGQGAPRCDPVDSRDVDKLVHAHARLLWLPRRGHPARRGRSRRVTRPGPDAIVPLRTRAVLPLLDKFKCAEVIPDAERRRRSGTFQVIPAGKSTFLDRGVSVLRLHDSREETC